MSHHQSQGKFKHDKPSFKWRGTGVHAYTSQPTEAARYVARCRQREIDKLNHRSTNIKRSLPVNDNFNNAQLERVA